MVKQLAMLVAVGLLGACVGYASKGNLDVGSAPWRTSPASLQVPPGPGDSSKTKTLFMDGRIQPNGGILEVAAPAGLRPTRFGPGVDEGKDVRAGTVLAYFEGHEERQEEIRIIDAQIEESRELRDAVTASEVKSLEAIDAERVRARTLGELQVASQASKIEILKKGVEFSQRRLDALEGLQVNHTVSKQEYEQHRASLERDIGELGFARAELARLENSLEIDTGQKKIDELKAKARSEARRARAANPLESLIRRRALAQKSLERTVVKAPVDGRIIKIVTQVGEASVGRPLLELCEAGPMYVAAEVYEDDRSRVHRGQKATITGRGLPEEGKPLQGEVERVDQTISGRSVSPLDPSAASSSRVIVVWVRLNDSDGEKVRPFNMQPVQVEIALDGESTAPATAMRR